MSHLSAPQCRLQALALAAGLALTAAAQATTLLLAGLLALALSRPQRTAQPEGDAP